MRRDAFTLVELLVVLAIVALLIGIIVPVLASARSTAIGSLCLANQSQLMVGVHQHAADNGGEIPFGPVEPGPGQLNGADDFYFINGMTTSQISSKTGDVVAAGLMLDLYLGETPEILFCPGNEQQVRAQQQLDQVGSGSVISGYIYRHGSNTNIELFESYESGERLDRAPRIESLGQNSQGQDISALFIDNNFVLASGSSFYEAFHRSNHEQRFVNIAYADGHAEQRSNADQHYSVDVIGTNLYAAVFKMREVLERADTAE